MVLCFEQTFDSATPVSDAESYVVVKLPIALPYTMSWENPDGQEGLVQDGDNFYNITHQQYANDTLYTVLKTNRNAHERFFELAERVNQLLDMGATPSDNPIDGLLKLVKKGLSNYLIPQFSLPNPRLVTDTLPVDFLPTSGLGLYSASLNRTSPPPEVY